MLSGDPENDTVQVLRPPSNHVKVNLAVRKFRAEGKIRFRYRSKTVSLRHGGRGGGVKLYIF